MSRPPADEPDRLGDLRMKKARYDGPIPARRGRLGWAVLESGKDQPPGDEEVWLFKPDGGPDTESWACPRYDLVFLDDAERNTQ